MFHSLPVTGKTPVRRKRDTRLEYSAMTLVNPVPCPPRTRLARLVAAAVLLFAPIAAGQSSPQVETVKAELGGLMTQFFVTISLEGDHLTFQVDGRQKLTLSAESTTRFLLPAGAGQITFTKAEDGRVLYTIQRGNGVVIKGTQEK